MNAEQRAALVKVLASWMRTAPLNRHLTIQEIAEDFIDRCVVPLVTTRAETEPDEDAVERAASAMWDDNHVRSGRRWEDAEHDQDMYRSMARVALQAAATNADEPDLTLVYQKGYQDGQDADLQRDIAAWARDTFDKPNQDHRLTKLGNEFEELRNLTTTDRANQAGIADECADIMHLMFQIAEAWEFDLLEETRKKFAINKARKWQPKPDGTYQHVKGDQP